MTIEQANAVNKVLRHLLSSRPARAGMSGEAWDAAALLADKAHKVLMAGLTGDDVRAVRMQVSS